MSNHQPDPSFSLPASGCLGSPGQKNLAKKRLFRLGMAGEGSFFSLDRRRAGVLGWGNGAMLDKGCSGLQAASALGTVLPSPRSRPPRSSGCGQ